MGTKDVNDALLSVTELDLVLRALGQEPSPKELSDIMDSYGSRSGKMNQDDFMDLMSSQIRANASDKNAETLSANTVQILQDSFRMFDQDRDGYLNADELKSALAMIGEDESSFQSILDDGDINRDQKIDLDEWIEMMK